MKYSVRRFSTSDHGTFGAFCINEVPVCVTLEQPWRDNQRNISCIPAGEYYVTPYTSAKYKDVWILHGVPYRDKILIHALNYVTETQGCIGVGTGFSPIQPMVTESKKALAALKQILPETFTLTIGDHYD